MADNRPSPRRHINNAAIRITLIYLTIGALWILFSDRMVAQLGSQELITRISIIKGWLYVAVTSSLLYYLIRKYFTEIETSRQQTQESDQRFRKLFTSAPLPLCYVTRDGVLADINERFIQVFGYGYDDVPTIDRWWQLAYPDEGYRAWVLDTWNAAVDKATASGCDIEPVEYNVTCKDGSVRTVLISGISLGFDVLATFFDVTERRLAEDALRENHARLKKVLEVETVGVMFWDLTSGCLTDANDTFLNIMGYSRRDVEARELTWQKLTPPEYMEVSAAEVKKFLSSGRVGPYEKEYYHKDGTRQWFIFAGSSLGDNACVEFCVDISDRKLAEWRLRRLAEVVERVAAVHELSQLMAIVRHAVRELTGADGATLVLRDGDQCHYADEDAIGPLWKGQRFPLKNCISGWSMLHSRAVVIEDIYADPRIPHAAYRSTFVQSLSMVPINRDTPVGAIGCYWKDSHRATDEELRLQQALADAMAVGLANLALIGQLEAEREKAEQSAREISRLNEGLEQRVEERTAELLAANRELDSFAYAVSHDLRAPLRAMNGFSQALVEDYGEQLQGESRVYLEQIILASRHMGELVDGLLTLSRSTRGEMLHDRLDLSRMAEQFRDELIRQEPDRPVTWRIEPGMLAHGDARMLEVVMRNLLGNAWKYTAGTTSPLIRVCTEERNGVCWYCVADNGAGFDMRHAERLFKPFQRLHRQDEFPGIGIGLATVQRIVHRHGGEINARAEPGKGAVFSFTLADSGVSCSEQGSTGGVT